METLRDSINELIEKTLTMEQQQVEDHRLQKMIQDAMDPCLQTQPYPSNTEVENMEESKTEVLQEGDQLEKTKISFRPGSRS